MRIYKITFIIIIASGFKLYAQESTNKNICLSPSISYVSENGIGNTGFALGLKGTKTLNNKFNANLGLTFFSTEIIANINQNAQNDFLGEERYYNAFFFTPSISYRFIGSQNTKISSMLSLGGSLFYYNSKVLESGTISHFDENRFVLTPGGFVNYRCKNEIKASLYIAFAIDFKISHKLKLGAFLDAYSSYDTPFEHLMPGINATFKLVKKKK